MKQYVYLFSLFLSMLVSLSSADAMIQPLYDSRIVIEQTATDLGNNMWQYNFNFTNTDTSEIYAFGMYTANTVSNITGTFPEVLTFNIPVDANLHEAYHPDDPNLSYMNQMFYRPIVSPTHGLPIGDAASFSFQANYYSDSFFYEYETVDSGYAVQNGGNVAATGYTVLVPEPISSTLFIVGGATLGFRRFRKKFKK